MSVSVITEPLFESGEIKFSDLRGTFTNKTNKITASELFRNTNNNEPNPKVPDATENANIAGNDYSVQSHGTDLSLLGFRNCIKTYDIKQESDQIDTNINLTTQTWNSNLSKNIPKSFIVEGTIGSTNPINPALTLSGVVRNFTIDLTGDGKIQGAGGGGGDISVNYGSSDTRRTGYVAGDGQDGGEALYINTNAPDPDTKTIKIKLVSGSQLYAGGGGGGMGYRGGNGGTGATVYGMNGGSGGMGGNPGNGGVGQGYSQTKTNGSIGSVGGAGGAGDTKEYQLPTYPLTTQPNSMTTYTFSAGNGGAGGNGGNGGNGGDWGSGGNTGCSTGSTLGDKGNSTSTTAPEDPMLFTAPPHPFTGMAIEYTYLRMNNLYDKERWWYNDSDAAPGSSWSQAVDPVYDDDGNTIGYERIYFRDRQRKAENDSWIDILTPTLAEGEVAAPNPRISLDGYGIVADGPGKIRVKVSWSDSATWGRSLNKVLIRYSGDGGHDPNYLSGSWPSAGHEYIWNSGIKDRTFDYKPNIANNVPTSISSPITGGAGYTNGATYNWATTGGSGSGLKVDITATGGVVQTVSINTTNLGSGYQVGDIIAITGGTTPATFEITSIGAGGNATFSITSVSGDGNLVSFSMFRAAGHLNFITFGGKYDDAQSNDIDPTGTIDTFGPGVNWSKTYVETLSYDFPSGNYGPIWGVDTNRPNYAIKGIQVSSNIFGYGLTGIQMDDDGGSDPDKDYNDLMIIPTSQEVIQLSILTILPPDPPSQPNVRGVGGNTGIAIKKIGATSYLLTGNNTDNLKGFY